LVNLMAAVTTVLPEEGSTFGAVVTPPDARGADLVVPDGLGPVLAVAGVLGVPRADLTLLTRPYSAGRQRSWTRA
jgi:hypothetical protein